MILWICVIIIAIVLAQVIWWRTRNMAITLLAVSIVLVLKSPWFWIAVVPLALWRVYQWYLYSSRPWKRIHFPMMRVHAITAGIEVSEAQSENRDWDIRNVLVRMVATARPDWNPPKILLFIAQEIAKMQSFHDRLLVKQHILKKHRQTNESNVDQFLDDIHSQLKMTDNGLLVRTIIAGLIEKKYGKEQKGEYLYAVFTEKAI